MQLFDLKDNKEAIYGALDAWVAWEQSFPIGPLRRALIALEKEQQWHRIIQVSCFHPFPLPQLCNGDLDYMNANQFHILRNCLHSADKMKNCKR